MPVTVGRVTTIRCATTEGGIGSPAPARTVSALKLVYDGTPNPIQEPVQLRQHRHRHTAEVQEALRRQRRGIGKLLFEVAMDSDERPIGVLRCLG